MNEREFNSCQLRQKMVTFQADGTTAEVFRCTENTSPHAFTDVKPADCVGCTVRKALLANPIPKRDTFANLDGMVKAEAADGFVGCKHRLVQVTYGCCGSGPALERWVCGTDESSNFRYEVTPVICQECPVRTRQAAVDVQK